MASPQGLSEAEAARRLIQAVKNELKTFELASATSSSSSASKVKCREDKSRLLLFSHMANASKIPPQLTYFCTEDGFFGVICLGLLITAMFLKPSGLNVVSGAEFGSWGGEPPGYQWTLLIGLAMIIPYLGLNAWLYFQARRVESRRAVAQVQEALYMYERCLPASASTPSVNEDHLAAEYEIPSCNLISVLRNGQWRRIPFNLVVTGDVVKIKFGDVVPCKMIPCVLRKSLVDGSHSLEPSGPPIEQGAVFGLPGDSSKRVGVLSSVTCLAMQTPCVTQIRNFLHTCSEEDSHTKMRSRLETPFFEIVEQVYCGYIRPIGWVALTLVLLSVLIRLLIFYLHTPNESSTFVVVPIFPYPELRDFFTAPVLVLIAFIPLAGRLLLDLTDLWGNARLQSLFLFHHERRYAQPCGKAATPPQRYWPLWNTKKSSDLIKYDTAINPRDGVSSNSSDKSSSSSVLSETGLSRPSSVDTALSISRVPLGKQLQEMRNVLHQGLDGSCNLLHSLNSTTYLCFLDHEGLLVETCQKIEEVCLIARDDVTDELKPCVLAVQDTSKDEGFHRLPSRASSVLTTEPTTSAGIRFVDEEESCKLMSNLRPLGLAMKVTQLPPPLPVSRDCDIGWVHALRFHDFFQRDLFDVDRFQACLCSLARLTDLAASCIQTVRHVLIVATHPKDLAQREPPSPSGKRSARRRRRSDSPWTRDGSAVIATPLSSMIMSDSSEHSSLDMRVTLLDSPLFADTLAVTDHSDVRVTKVSLTKDTRTNCIQFFAKGKPEDMLQQCKFVFDGSQVRPLTPSLVGKVEGVLMQWKSLGFEAFGFAFCPVKEDTQTLLLHSLEEHTVVNVSQSRRGANSEVWRPLVIHPGPRSVALRPEPFVVASEMLTASSVANSNEVATMLKAVSEADLVAARRGSHSDAKYVRLLNYDNSVLQVPVSDQSSSMSLYQKASWLPVNTAFIGVEIIRQMINSQLIFLGLAAIKPRTPSPVPERLADFHAAGVRFTLYSRENLKETRALGSVLGLETGWNSIISLEESDSDAVHINQDGNAVLPAGIDGIKEHLRDIDDIPLLVSLYANATAPTTRQLLKLLNKRGEIVTCVGSALRTSNFDLFNEVACPVSILLLPYSLCLECHGRRNLGTFYHPMLLPEFSFSAALTSLPCALQSHAVSFHPASPMRILGKEGLINQDEESYPEFLLQLLYSSFQESRRIVTSIESCLIYYCLCGPGICGLLVSFTHLLIWPSVMNSISTLAVLFFFLPVPALSLFFNPVGEDCMVEFPRTVIRRHATQSPDSSESTDAAYKRCETKKHMGPFVIIHSVRIIIPVLSSAILTCCHWKWLLDASIETFPDSILDDDIASKRHQACIVDWRPILTWLTGHWTRCGFYVAQAEASVTQNRSDVQLRRISMLTGYFNGWLLLLHCYVLSLSYVSKFESVWEVPPWKNRKLLPTLGVMYCLAVALGCIAMTAELGGGIISPPGWWWGSAVGSVVASLVVAEVGKTVQRNHHEVEQKFLKLLFQTRLGMWSPK